MTFFMATTAFYYYEQEKRGHQKHFDMMLDNAYMNIKSDLMQSLASEHEYIFQTPNSIFNYAFLDKNGSFVYDTLALKPSFDMNKSGKQKVIIDDACVYLVHSLDHPNFSKVIIEDPVVYKDWEKFELQLLIICLIAIVCILTLGYVLTQILIRPIKRREAHLKELLKTVSHEINTPIAAITMIMPALRESSLEEKTINHIAISIKNIKQTHDKMAYILHQGLFEVFEEDFDLADIVRESITFYTEIALGKGIQVETLPTDSCFVRMDRYQAKMIVNNLFSNAIKYSHEGTCIKVGLQNNILTVRDEGIGVEDDRQEEIFQKYKRLNYKEEGFGLGLYIVKEICDYFHISIALHSRIGKGSEFVIDFSKIAK